MAALYQQLCPVLFGDNAVGEMAKQIAEKGYKHVFICCDAGVRKAGIVELVENALKEEGLSYSMYDEILPDTPDTVVDELAAKIKETGADIILAVGGGSTMDAAKAAGVVLDNGDSIRKYMEENGNPGFVVKTPVYAIPTNAGTGSENTPMCVIHELSTDTKKVVLRPAELAVLDPKLTVSCPKSVTVYSGFDALSHAVEASTSVAPNPRDMLLALHAIRLIVNNLPIAMNEPENLEARTNLLFASNIAGIAFATMSVHIGHCFDHEAGVKFHMEHGHCCALSIPETLRIVAEDKPAEILQIADAMGVKIPEGTGAKEAADLVADRVRSLMRECGIKPLKECGVSKEDAIAIAQDALDHNWFHVMCPGDVSREKMEQYIANIYDNYL
ncbi:MAG: iron-containing alcohol dehydrogenase [Lachnospiraceae bacterium]|nr:iron-containing alcohol dehydrogenase [Lachnospiraceae bacterium]